MVKSWVFSKSVMLRICKISFKLRSTLSSFFRIATRTYTLIEIHTWVLTALGEAPKNVLMRRFCLIHLKKSSMNHP